jgi:hypothetical protein
VLFVNVLDKLRRLLGLHQRGALKMRMRETKRCAHCGGEGGLVGDDVGARLSDGQLMSFRYFACLDCGARWKIEEEISMPRGGNSCPTQKNP